MESFKQSNATLYDELRKMWVVPHPEEIVRQTLIQKMMHTLKYPKELIAVEVNLKSLPLLSQSVPDRRADLVVFGKNIHPDHELYPLLLIECKAEAISKKALEQLMGYNHHVKASFIALVGKEETLVAFCKKDGTTQFLSFLPSYEQLLSACAL